MLHRIAVTFLLLSILSVPTFAQDTKTSEPSDNPVCLLDTVPEGVLDSTKWEARADNPVITKFEVKTEDTSLLFPIKVWDYRTLDKSHYVRFVTLSNAKDQDDAFLVVNICPLNKEIRLNLKINGQWQTAKEPNTDIAYSMPRVNAKGELISVTITIGTKEGNKELVLNLK